MLAQIQQQLYLKGLPEEPLMSRKHFHVDWFELLKLWKTKKTRKMVLRGPGAI